MVSNVQIQLTWKPEYYPKMKGRPWHKKNESPDHRNSIFLKYFVVLWERVDKSSSNQRDSIDPLSDTSQTGQSISTFLLAGRDGKAHGNQGHIQ